MIFYFSCTGNTLWAAKTTSLALKEKIENISNIDSSTYTIELKENENLGFCFPVHGWRPPSIVRAFIKNLAVRCSHKPYCFVICTAGDDIGETFEIFKEDFKHTGIEIDSCISLIMPETYVGLPGMLTDKPDKVIEKKKKAREDLRIFIQSLIHHKTDNHQIIKGKYPKLKSKLLGLLFYKYLQTDKPFRVDNNACIKCGLCNKVCPTHNIKMSNNGEPIWARNNNCISCFSCYHHCPKHAIEYGNQTKNKGQYYFDKDL